MFILPIQKNGVATITGTSSATFIESDSIPLTSKRYDGKRLSLKIEVTSGASRLYFHPIVGGTIDGKYAPFTTGSGTSLLKSPGAGFDFTAYNSISGASVHYVPLSVVVGSGSTKWLTTVPGFKLAYRAAGTTTNFRAWLFIG